jgi:hypothetical protein
MDRPGLLITQRTRMALSGRWRPVQGHGGQRASLGMQLTSATSHRLALLPAVAPAVHGQEERPDDQADEHEVPGHLHGGQHPGGLSQRLHGAQGWVPRAQDGAQIWAGGEQATRTARRAVTPRSATTQDGPGQQVVQDDEGGRVEHRPRQRPQHLVVLTTDVVEARRGGLIT